MIMPSLKSLATEYNLSLFEVKRLQRERKRAVDRIGKKAKTMGIPNRVKIPSVESMIRATSGKLNIDTQIDYLKTMNAKWFYEEATKYPTRYVNNIIKIVKDGSEYNCNMTWKDRKELTEIMERIKNNPAVAAKFYSYSKTAESNGVIGEFFAVYYNDEVDENGQDFDGLGYLEFVKGFAKEFLE